MKYLPVVFILLLAACSPPSVQQLHKEPVRKWRPTDIVGFRLSNRSESYDFRKDGTVFSTLGNPDVGPVTAPILYWKIDNEGALVIWDSNSIVRLRKLREQWRRVYVDDNGTIISYKKQRWWIPLAVPALALVVLLFQLGKRRILPRIGTFQGVCRQQQPGLYWLFVLLLIATYSYAVYSVWTP